MHIHILGICGTAMGGIALLAREAGHTVTGCDTGVYPPMSTQLQAQGITLIEGWDEAQLSPDIDVYVIGNALSRGNPLVEAILNRGLPYTSGAQWLADHVLQGRWVLAVAGTHGKTTTSAMLAWMLECAGFAPGFLIGGVPENFGVSARLGDSDFFVIEADEYDTAFFDKRSKFVHYRPRTAILNNLEFDHADIFADLAAIETQFHHLVRTVPAQGAVVVNTGEPALARVLARGCWAEHIGFNVSSATDAGWRVGQVFAEGHFEVFFNGALQGTVDCQLTGAHNRSNILAAIAAARHIGIAPMVSIDAMRSFLSVKRRMEVRGSVGNVTVYDDFAHHPTAIATTLAGLRGHIGASGAARILAVLEPRSNTMKLGVMKDALVASLLDADLIFGYGAGNAAGKQALGWDLAAALAPLGHKARAYTDLASLVAAVVAAARAGDHIVCMSNGGFEGVHNKLLEALSHQRGLAVTS